VDESVAGMTEAELGALRTDDAAWDRFVESTPDGQYLQLSAWREIKQPNGWRAIRVVADGGASPIGAQVLLRKLGPLPASLGYAPCGPLAGRLDERGIVAFSAELRAVGGRELLSHVTVDPFTDQRDVPELLRAAGWRRAAPVQIDRTWVVDLTTEDELWQGMRPKWRQYVQKARRAGHTISEAGAEGVDELFDIIVETSKRAGFLYRSRATHRAVYDAYAAGGRARTLICRAPDGTPAAALMLVSCGGRVVEPFGGMTAAGAAARANYLVKWEAMRSSLERGHTLYDMWGMATPGIAHFKQGFGGREVRYPGAFDLVMRRATRSFFLAAQQARIVVGRIRRGGRGGRPGFAAAE
jgi:lipid II:glycine glycyltransferase (peptidoglycan interpeptide bridge formation enzyme)